MANELDALPESVRRDIGIIARALVLCDDEAAAAFNRLTARVQGLERELAESRETIKRLNRRVQVAEAGIAEKMKAAAPGSLGRALANAAADMLANERDEALAELAALKKRIGESPTARFCGCAITLDDPVHAWATSPTRVALLPLDDEAKG